MFDWIKGRFKERTSWDGGALVAVGVVGLFFSAIQHAVHAGWSVNIRRLSESMTAFLPVVLFGVLSAPGSDCRCPCL